MEEQVGLVDDPDDDGPDTVAGFNFLGHNVTGDWILIDGDANIDDFASADPAASEEMMITTLRRVIASLEAKFRAERLLDVTEAADELVVLCDELDKAEEDEEERLQRVDDDRHPDGHTAGSNSRSSSATADPSIMDSMPEHRDYEDIEGRIVMRGRRSAASLRRGLLGESEIIIKGLVWLLYNGDCQVRKTDLSAPKSCFESGA
jgi:hypothetical protein